MTNCTKYYVCSLLLSSLVLVLNTKMCIGQKNVVLVLVQFPKTELQLAALNAAYEHLDIVISWKAYHFSPKIAEKLYELQAELNSGVHATTQQQQKKIYGAVWSVVSVFGSE